MHFWQGVVTTPVGPGVVTTPVGHGPIHGPWAHRLLGSWAHAPWARAHGLMGSWVRQPMGPAHGLLGTWAHGRIVVSRNLGSPVRLLAFHNYSTGVPQMSISVLSHTFSYRLGNEFAIG